MGTENYTLGRGEVHFSRFKAGTQIGEGYRYLGNSPEWSLTLESETLDHYNNDRGIREKDKSITLEVSRTGTLVIDEITMPNLAMFLFSADGATTVTEAGGAVTGYAINDVIKGRSYQLGESDSNPSGDMKVTSVSVKKGATVYTAGDDYLLDAARGIVTILADGSIVTGDDITVDYTVQASTREQVVSGSEKVEGALKYIEYNASGPNKVWTMPYVTFAPNGDLAFKGDEWQQIPLTVEVLRKGGLEAIYADGVAA